MKRYLHTIVLASITLSIASCGKKDQQAANGPLPYKVIQVPTQDIVGHQSFPTTIQGKVNSAVRAKVSGYIEKLFVDEGTIVKKGQPLFQIETNILTQNADAAKAAIKTAQAQVNIAQVNVNKIQPLVDKGIVSKIQLETAMADLAATQSQLAAAKANYNSIVANIDFAIVRSPVDGVVGAIAFREGALVGPTDQIPLTTVSDDSEVFSYFSMNEKEYFSFLEKMEGKTMKEKIANLPAVSLVLANGQTYEHQGKIETITGQVNINTGTIQVRAAFKNPDHLLSNGNSGTLLLPKSYKDALVVPESSTFEQQGSVYVYQVVNDTVKTAKVEVIDRVNQLAVIKSGVTKGETIVGTGLGTLKPGTAITPVPTEFKSINEAIKPIF